MGLGLGLGLESGLGRVARIRVRLRELTEGIDELDMRQSTAQETRCLGTRAREARQSF